MQDIDRKGYLFSNSDLVKLILPLVVEQLLAITVGMADTIMIAAVGESAVSAVSLVDSVNILLINIFAALATGRARWSAGSFWANGSRNGPVSPRTSLCCLPPARQSLSW